MFTHRKTSAAHPLTPMPGNKIPSTSLHNLSTAGLAGASGLISLLACSVANAMDQSPDARAYVLEAAYTGDIWHNAHGGLRTGTAYLDNIDVTLGVDGERAWGIKGLSAFGYVLYNNRKRFSETYVGDAMTVSNIDAAHAVRLYEAWLEWTSESQSFALRGGLYDMNSEFDTSDGRALFIHSSHGVGHELGQTGLNGPSIFPVTSLALRAAWQPARNWRLLAAVMDGVPGDPNHPDHSDIHLSRAEGVLALTEIQWSSGRIHKLAAGYWRYSADFPDLRESIGDAPERDDNAGMYAAVEVALGESAAPGTLMFVRYGVANDRINEFDRSIGVGLRSQGLFANRPDDALGIAFTRADLGAAARQNYAGSSSPAYEAALELTYRAVLNDWLTLQPDIQYIFNPGAAANLADSLAVGLRFELSMSCER